MHGTHLDIDELRADVELGMPSLVHACLSVVTSRGCGGPQRRRDVRTREIVALEQQRFARRLG